MFQGVPPRLSVDLDFNYIGSLERETMVAERPALEHAGLKYFLNYVSANESRDRIEIDLNFMHRLPLTPPYRDVMWQPEGLERPTLQIVGREEVCAGKICAMLDRYKPRDLFDAIRLPKLAGDFWRTMKFKRLAIAFTGILVHPLHSDGKERLERVRDIDIEAELVPMLGSGEPMNREALISGAWSAIEEIVTLDDLEREFVDRLQAGEIKADLLFPDDPDMADRVALWPPLLWKAGNVREHLSGQDKPSKPRKKL